MALWNVQWKIYLSTEEEVSIILDTDNIDVNLVDFHLQSDTQYDKISIRSLTDLEQYVQMVREEILNKHNNKISQLSKGRYQGYWQTFVYDTSGRRKIVRGKTKKDVENKIIDYYSASGSHTIGECYEGWINYLSINKKPSTIHAYDKIQKRHFKKWDNKPIDELSPYEIKVFVKKEVAEKNLTAKGYSALKTNLLGIFHYAKDIYGYNKVDIDGIVADLSRELRGSFRRSEKFRKKDSDLIFLSEEAELVTNYCLESGMQVDLGIYLMFETGIRVGELAALKKEDIASDYKSLSICRTEERISSKADYIVSDTTKTEAGTREVLLTAKATRIIKKILFQSNKYSDFLFSDLNFERYPAKKFRDRLYRICIILDIPKKSPHAIRRTYASKLYKAGVSELLIVKQMGHIDFEVTKMFYIYNDENRNEMIAELENVM